jgi:hypothetical protein
MSSNPNPKNDKKSRRPKWSRENPAYLESEVAWAEAGARFVPFRKTQLEAAIREDMKKVLDEVSKYAVDDRNMDWLVAGDTPTKVLGRVARALEFLRTDRSNDVEDVEDAEEVDEEDAEEVDEEVDEKVDSYEYGRTLVLDLAVENINGSTKTDDDIHACMIALVAAGRVQQAFDLARLAGALRCVRPFVADFKTVELIPSSGSPVRSVRPITRSLRQYRIITTLQQLLDKNEIPTKRRLCYKAFGAAKAEGLSVGTPNVNDTDFSKLLRRMSITRLIPDEPRCAKQKVMGTTYKLDLTGPGARIDAITTPAATPRQAPLIWDEPIYPHSGTPRLATVQSLLVRKRDGIFRLVGLNCRLIERAPGLYQLLSGTARVPTRQRPSPRHRAAYFDRDLTRIKEALGLVFDALLLQLQMTEPTTPGELDQFVEKLALLGLELGWARKQKQPMNPKPVEPG